MIDILTKSITSHLAFSLDNLSSLLLAPLEFFLFLALLPRQLLLRDLIVQELELGDTTLHLHGCLELAVKGFDGDGRESLARAFFLA